MPPTALTIGSGQGAGVLVCGIGPQVGGSCSTWGGTARPARRSGSRRTSSSWRPARTGLERDDLEAGLREDVRRDPPAPPSPTSTTSVTGAADISRGADRRRSRRGGPRGAEQGEPAAGDPGHAGSQNRARSRARAAPRRRRASAPSRGLEHAILAAAVSAANAAPSRSRASSSSASSRLPASGTCSPLRSTRPRDSGRRPPRPRLARARRPGSAARAQPRAPPRRRSRARPSLRDAEMLPRDVAKASRRRKRGPGRPREHVGVVAQSETCGRSSPARVRKTQVLEAVARSPSMWMSGFATRWKSSPESIPKAVPTLSSSICLIAAGPLKEPRLPDPFAVRREQLRVGGELALVERAAIGHEEHRDLLDVLQALQPCLDARHATPLRRQDAAAAAAASIGEKPMSRVIAWRAIFQRPFSRRRSSL